jgi:hypothetical protein
VATKTADLKAVAEAMADSIRRMLAAIEAGELTASTAMRYRLEGALAALETLLGEPSTVFGPVAEYHDPQLR